jgi:hypothetical protein
LVAQPKKATDKLYFFELWCVTWVATKTINMG